MNDFDQIMANANNNTTKSNKSFDKNGMKVQLNEDNATFVNVDFNCNTSDLNKINLLNKLII